MRRYTARLFGFLAVSAIAAFIGAGAYVYYGGYDTSALQQHSEPVYRVLQYVRERSILARSDFDTPDLASLDWQHAGLMTYETYCRQCHGAPGRAPDSFSLGMKPAPTAIAELARKRSPQELYEVIEQGIKMTGMPAWAYRLNQAEMWQLVALVKQIANMTHADYDNYLVQAQEESPQQTETRPRRSEEIASATELPTMEGLSRIDAGRVAMQQYNCTSCHMIPGVTAARNQVGPPLGGITQRSYIAGLLEYSDNNLIKWIRFPTTVDKDTLMPDLGVSQVHAEAMLAYLKSVE